MDESKKVKYIPFHAINEFMRDDYRLQILNEVLANLNKITSSQKTNLQRMISRKVKIQGFRNSGIAPAPIKARNSTGLFESSAEFAGEVIESWCGLHAALKNVLGDILKELDWKIQPLGLDRSKLPGFQVDWPAKDTFEVIINKVRENATDLSGESDDDISLMAVWVGNRLPYDLFQEPGS